MKIFNWVHRRFNNNKAENGKNNGDDICDEQFPVVENKGNHVLERWRGGILMTIGTLGYDPLKDESEQLDDYFYDEADDGEEVEVETEDEDEDEEKNPLVIEVAEMEMAENWSNEEEHEDEVQFGYEYMMMKKKERTTLADLFSADADDVDQEQMKAIHNNNKAAQLLLMKEKEKSNHRKLNIAKEARPIHKFNQLMRRMLKRKIHPDVGPMNSKVAPGNNNIKCRPTPTDDSASLLPLTTRVLANANI